MQTHLLRLLLLGGAWAGAAVAQPATPGAQPDTPDAKPDTTEPSTWIEGRWRITRGLVAPWIAADAAQPDARALLGSTIEFGADRVDGPSALTCANARYEEDARLPEGLFQGGLPAPATEHAARLGFTGAAVKSMSVACDTGLFDFHQASQQAAMLALDNVIWVLDRSPGALARDDQPQRPVQLLLEAHFNGDMGFLPALVANKDGWMSAGLRDRIAKYFAYPWPADEVPPINGDPFTNSQEYPVLFSVREGLINKDRASVPVRFDDGHAARAIDYLMLREEGAWRVDDLRYEDGTTFRTALLVPAG
jgi:hypothetical protein